jgi:23S rRNA (guanosine2251-2'-O)-methyltransferase
MRKLTMDELHRIDAEEFKTKEKIPVRIILDNIRSLHNIGSVFRTADAFRVDSIYLCGICATPPSKEMHKTALGATDTVKWEYFTETSLALKRCTEEGFTIVLVEQTDVSKDITGFNYGNQPIAFVFGNEVNGISESCLSLADHAIEIPQFGTKHSFNISITVGIVLYDFFLKSGAFFLTDEGN